LGVSGYAVKGASEFKGRLNMLLEDNSVLAKKQQQLCKAFVFQHKEATEVVFGGVEEVIN